MGSTLMNGRYRLEERIGQGGFGTTWRATDELLDMPVAVKVFSDPDGGNRDRYLREARGLARFSGEQGIVAVRDYFEQDGSFYLVMEYLEGEDLSSYLERNGAMSLAEALALFDPVMETLEHLHAEGVIHRDISPDNLRMLPDGRVKLIDFGSALSVSTAAERGTVTVKPGYAPPEQYGDAQTQGPWTDVYALAATMYHCITGRKPMDSLRRTFHDEMPAPASLGASIDAGVESALMSALALDPQERVQSVGELRALMGGQREEGRDFAVETQAGEGSAREGSAREGAVAVTDAAGRGPAGKAPKPEGAATGPVATPTRKASGGGRSAHRRAPRRSSLKTPSLPRAGNGLRASRSGARSRLS